MSVTNCSNNVILFRQNNFNIYAPGVGWRGWDALKGFESKKKYTVITDQEKIYFFQREQGIICYQLSKNCILESRLVLDKASSKKRFSTTLIPTHSPEVKLWAISTKHHDHLLVQIFEKNNLRSVYKIPSVNNRFTPSSLLYFRQQDENGYLIKSDGYLLVAQVTDSGLQMHHFKIDHLGKLELQDQECLKVSPTGSPALLESADGHIHCYFPIHDKIMVKRYNTHTCKWIENKKPLARQFNGDPLILGEIPFQKSLTLETWIKPSPLTDAELADFQGLLRLTKEGRLIACFDGNPFSSKPVIFANRWTHVAMTYKMGEAIEFDPNRKDHFKFYHVEHRDKELKIEGWIEPKWHEFKSVMISSKYYKVSIEKNILTLKVKCIGGTVEESTAILVNHPSFIKMELQLLEEGYRYKFVINGREISDQGKSKLYRIKKSNGFVELGGGVIPYCGTMAKVKINDKELISSQYTYNVRFHPLSEIGLFVNGTPVELSPVALKPTEKFFHLSKIYPVLGDKFYGEMSAFRILKEVKTAEEVDLELYKENKDDTRILASIPEKTESDPPLLNEGPWIEHLPVNVKHPKVCEFQENDLIRRIYVLGMKLEFYTVGKLKRRYHKTKVTEPMLMGFTEGAPPCPMAMLNPFSFDHYADKGAEISFGNTRKHTSQWTNTGIRDNQIVDESKAMAILDIATFDIFQMHLIGSPFTAYLSAELEKSRPINKPMEFFKPVKQASPQPGFAQHYAWSIEGGLRFTDKSRIEQMHDYYNGPTPEGTLNCTQLITSRQVTHESKVEIHFHLPPREDIDVPGFQFSVIYHPPSKKNIEILKEIAHSLEPRLEAAIKNQTAAWRISYRIASSPFITQLPKLIPERVEPTITPSKVQPPKVLVALKMPQQNFVTLIENQIYDIRTLSSNHTSYLPLTVDELAHLFGDKIRSKLSGDEGVTAKLELLRLMSDEQIKKLLLYRKYQEGDIVKAMGAYQAHFLLAPNLHNQPGGGIMNLGATCYLSAALQLLRVLPYFRQELELISERPKSAVFAKVLLDLFDRLDRQELVDPSQFFDLCLHSHWWGENSQTQQDAIEFIRWLRQELGAVLSPVQIKRTRNQKSITYIQDIELTSSLPTVEHVNRAFEQKHRSVRDLTQQSRIDISSVKFAAQIDQKIDAIPPIDPNLLIHLQVFDELGDYRDEIQSPPRYFLQSFKRYESAMSSHAIPDRKNMVKIDLNKQITLNRTQYQPQAVILHQGSSMAFGHYTTMVRHDGWYHYDDTTCRPEEAKGEVCMILWIASAEN